MPIEQEKQNRIARSIIKVVHECYPGMKQGIVYYRNALDRNDPVEALALLKRAARLPYRVEARVQAMVAKFGAPAINNALSNVSTFTLSDLSAELAPLKIYSDQLKDNYINQGWTQEQIAIDIEATAPSIDRDEVAPIPDAYIDDM